MNAAYLLLTSAWMAGADAAPVAPAAAAPVVSTGACCGGGCATSCDPCANHCGPSLLDRVRARFHRNDCCDSGCNAPVVHHKCCTPAPAPTCCTPVKTCAPACNTCQPACDPCRPKFQMPKFNFNFHRNNDCCNTCNTGCSAPVVRHDCGCNDSCRPSLLDRLRSRFHRNDCCDTGCNTGCNGGCGSVGTATPAPAAAPVEAPKAMPKAGAAFNGGSNVTVLSVQ
ncbi:MAG: hypothetical protein K1X57_14815 [Gemmataceae bacterium]|nr:hypothetical protein [Gemmataceae bacterium]